MVVDRLSWNWFILIDQVQLFHILFNPGILLLLFLQSELLIFFFDPILLIYLFLQLIPEHLSLTQLLILHDRCLISSFKD